VSNGGGKDVKARLHQPCGMGIGFRVQEGLDDLLIILQTSSTDKGEKLSSFIAGAAVSEKGGLI